MNCEDTGGEISKAELTVQKKKKKEDDGHESNKNEEEEEDDDDKSKKKKSNRRRLGRGSEEWRLGLYQVSFFLFFS